MLITQDFDMSELIPMLRHNGHCPYPADREDYWIPAMGNVELPVLNGDVLWPGNYCLGEVECALGSVLLDRGDQINMEKRQRALHVIDALADCQELIFHREPTMRHNYHLLVAQVTNGNRNSFIRRMANNHKIQCVVQYCPLNRYPFYQKLGFGEAYCPNTDTFFDNMVSFPFHHLLDDKEIDQIIDAIRETIIYLRHS